MSSFKVFTTVTCRCGKEMESRDIFEDGEWRCACGESANIPTHTTLQRERDEAIGIGPGSNDGPYKNCRDCGRRMIWSDPGSESPTWMCPRCVRGRMMQAEKEQEGSMNLIDKLQIEISDLSNQAGEMQKQINDAECKKIDATQKCERWEQAARTMAEDGGEAIFSDTMMGLEPSVKRALGNGDLEALEEVLDIKP